MFYRVTSLNAKKKYVLVLKFCKYVYENNRTPHWIGACVVFILLSIYEYEEGSKKEVDQTSIDNLRFIITTTASRSQTASKQSTKHNLFALSDK